MKQSSFRNLKVWQTSHEWVIRFYQSTRGFAGEERFRLADQLRRAAASVPTKIAESDGRFTRPDQIRLLPIARGSLYESEYLLILCQSLGYIELGESDLLARKAGEIARMLNGLIRQKREAS